MDVIEIVHYKHTFDFQPTRQCVSLSSSISSLVFLVCVTSGL